MTQSPWLELNQAIKKMCSSATPIPGVEHLPLSDCLGKIIVEPVIATLNVPPCDNSAMDGYALRAEDGQAGTQLSIVDTVLAGSSHIPTVAPGQCVRITTGAPVPTDCNTVIMQENVVKEEQSITLNFPVAAQENIRRQGSDISVGTRVLDKGHRIQAADLMLMSSLGIEKIAVVKGLTVGLLATGDELVEAGSPLSPGQIYESNRAGITALLAPYSVEIKNYGIVKDNPDTLRAVFQRAQSECDVIVSSGGVSVGDADFVKDILDELGNIGFWKVAIKPGKPFAFGKINNAYFCGLPGNPVSAYVTSEQLLLPFIRHLQGETLSVDSHRTTLLAKLSTPVKRRAGRLDFQRAIYRQQPDGTLLVTPLQKQSSGVMTSFSIANCYLLIPAEADHIAQGELVSIQPFSLSDSV